jgi:UDP-N-acetylmuramoyl-L-alanyl-D-glutamate--2,6-diaminopimelate ligase
MPGDFNIINGLAAATVGKILGIDTASIKKSLASFAGIPGRFEYVPNTRGFQIVIDFAHKPDALEGVLQVAIAMTRKKGRVIVMFGCASERDTLKRPIMGEISGRLADITVLTDEDPRHEEPMKIIDEIAAGCLKAGAVEIENGKLRIEKDQERVFYKIPDRGEAIGFILNTLAKKGDVILLCGKGHEQSMNYNGVEKPWSEKEAVERALE